MLYLLIALFAALQLADIVTTHYVLKKRIGTEANPVMRWLFDQFGHLPVLLVIKGALIAFFWWWVPQVDERLVWALAALYAWVVWNNAQVIKNAR